MSNYRQLGLILSQRYLHLYPLVLSATLNDAYMLRRSC